MNRISIKILSPNIDLLGEVDLYNSLFIDDSYDSVGEFQITTSVTRNKLKLFKKNNFIMIGNDCEKVGIIQYKSIDLNDEGKEILTIRGKSLDSILQSRVVHLGDDKSESVFVGKSTTLINKLMTDNLISPTNPNRRIHNILVSIDDSLGELINWKIESSLDVGQAITEICKVNNLGYKMYLHLPTKKIMFEIYKGVDKTNDVVFSLDLDNIGRMNYVESNAHEKNVVYIRTEQAKVEFVTEYSNEETSGIDRLEVFTNHKELDGEETIEMIGKNTLQDFVGVDSITGEMFSTHLFEYKKDFNLGDVVTVQNKGWGVVKKLRVMDIRQVYEDRPRILITFGDELPTLATTIKNYVTNYSK